MSDAQFDSDFGSGIQNWIEEWIGNKSADEALNWYGLYSLALGFWGIFGWHLMNDNVNVARIPTWWTQLYRYYLPVGMTWWLLRFFGNYKFLSQTLWTVTGLSILGPFMHQTIAIGTFVASSENFYGDGDFWITLVGYTFATMCEMLVQIGVLKRVFQGIGEGKYDGQATWHFIENFAF